MTTKKVSPEKFNLTLKTIVSEILDINDEETKEYLLTTLAIGLTMNTDNLELEAEEIKREILKVIKVEKAASTLLSNSDLPLLSDTTKHTLINIINS